MCGVGEGDRRCEVCHTHAYACALCLCRSPCSEVHIWCVDPELVLGRSDLMAEYEGMLSEEERAQLGSAESEDVRRQRLLTRALARVTIARCQFLVPLEP